MSGNRVLLVRGLACCGLVAAALSTIGWLVPGLLEPHYSFANNDLSDLGALGAHHALAYNACDSASGLLTIGLAVALICLFGRRWVVVAATTSLALAGVGAFVDGLAREDCSVSISATCRAAERAGRLSRHHRAHNVESLLTFILLIQAPQLLGLALRFQPRWRAIRWCSWLAAAIQAILLPIFLTMYAAGTAGQGLGEIAGAVAGSLWLGGVSIAVVRSPRSPV
jgi:hypothetical membrane protein